MFGISTVFAFASERAIEDFILVSKILLMTLLMTRLIDSQERLQLFFKVLSMGLGAYALKGGIYVLLTGGVAPIEGPRDTYLEGNNTLGMVLAMNVPFLYYLSRIETKRWLRWGMWLMLGFSYVAVAGTFSRGNWVGVAVVTALMVVKSKQKIIIWPIAVAAFAVAIVVTPYIVSEQIAARYDSLENYSADPSVESRYWNWEFCKRVGMSNALTGAGFRFYSLEAYGRYYPEFLNRWPGKVWSCHNMWLSVFAEHGLIAFLVWFGLVVSCLLATVHLCRLAKLYEEAAWVKPYADMIQVSLLGFIVMGSFVDFAYYEGYYQVVASVIVLKELLRKDVTVASKVCLSTVALDGRLGGGAHIIGEGR
jgi:probable O-glycosylation ligase (exosortase A-associated)